MRASVEAQGAEPGGGMGEVKDETDGVDIAPENRFALLWRRIRQHRIAQWTVGYVAVAYSIQHAVILTSESYEWPNIIARVSMTLLALGLPIAMTLAWYHGDRTPRRISSGELAVVSAVLLGISFAFYLFVRPVEPSLNTAAPPTDNIIGAPASTALAVLPLANVSGDKEQEFFSDGMTDEISSALAKVPALRVVGRQSAFEFKGKNQNDRAIGHALGARYLLEGSVRKAGDRVRITAQLVRAEDGVQIWSENYDRDLVDVFTVQEDVARAIAASLRAKALVRSRSSDAFAQLTQAAKLLEQAVAREPDYAPAWALLALDYVLTPGNNGAYASGEREQMLFFAETLIPKAEAAARRAIELDPKSADAHVALASVQAGRTQLKSADELFRQALELDPGNADGLHLYSGMLADAGFIKKAIPMRERLQALEPLVPVFQMI